MSNKKYKLKERLKATEKWIEYFLDVEKNRSISKKALKALNKDKPILGFIFRIIYLPTRIWDFISDIIWWNRYRKCCKEIEFIKQELKNYTSSDYLLLSGDPSVIGIACSIVSDINHGKFNLLKWDRQEQMYYPLEINLYEKGKIDD